MKYKLEIKPALEPEERHKIEDVLKKMGYVVWAGGTHTDGSACDIAFNKEEEENMEEKVKCPTEYPNLFDLKEKELNGPATTE